MVDFLLNVVSKGLVALCTRYFEGIHGLFKLEIISKYFTIWFFESCLNFRDLLWRFSYYFAKRRDYFMLPPNINSYIHLMVEYQLIKTQIYKTISLNALQVKKKMSSTKLRVLKPRNNPASPPTPTATTRENYTLLH